MPHLKHVVSHKYNPTFRSESVVGMFDVPIVGEIKKEWDVNIPIEDKKWQIGLIVGASGAGKTVLARKLFGSEFCFNGNEWKESCLLDDFSEKLNVKDITTYLSKVGFSSPPSWILPYSALSNGQKFRADLARCLIENDNLIVFDEFTSVVDRTVAKAGCHAVSKLIRKDNKHFVAVSCHYDIEEYLQPDWVFDVSLNKFKWGCLRRKPIKLKIYKCDKDAWRLFKDNHYLSANLSTSAQCYVAFIDKVPVGFSSFIHLVHPKIKNTKREHRTVVLPDFQGFGIGNMLSEFMGSLLAEKNLRFRSTTSHPAMCAQRVNSKKWRLTKKPSRTLVPKQGKQSANSGARLTASFEYTG